MNDIKFLTGAIVFQGFLFNLGAYNGNFVPNRNNKKFSARPMNRCLLSLLQIGRGQRALLFIKLRNVMGFVCDGNQSLIIFPL